MTNCNTLIIAHRGGPSMGPHENTIEAFEKAISVGADMVEFDVRRTIDGQLICHHDAHIGTTKIADISYFDVNNQARELGYEIPLLKDVIAITKNRIKLDIEIKEVGYELEIINMVKEQLNFEEFIMKSFHDSTVMAIKIINPKIFTGLLVEARPFHNPLFNFASMASFEPRILATKADFLSPELVMVNRTLLARMKAMKKPLYVWTVNDDTHLQKLLDYNVAAIITDRPDVALAMRNAQTT